jgi:hypothetical protein
MTTPDGGAPTAPAPPPPAGPPASETLAWPPAGPPTPFPARPNRFRAWLAGLTPLTAGLLAVVLLAVGFGAGVLTGRHGQHDVSRVGPGLRQRGPAVGPVNPGNPGNPGAPNRQQPPGFGGGAGRGFGGGFGNATAGTVVSVGGNTMTVRAANGATVKVTITGSTSIRVTRTGTVSDLKAGTPVVVLGTGSNGAVTARSITSGAAPAGPAG